MNNKTVELNSSGVITEIRTYRIKAGRREEFLRHFDASVAPLQRSKGIAVVGPFREIENSDTIVWFRAFPSLDDRERMLDAFRESDEWKGGLKDIMANMCESQTVVLLPGLITNEVKADS